MNLNVCELSTFESLSCKPPTKQKCINKSMVGMLVPLKGGLGSIFHPPEGKDYKWYISGIFPANWGIICYGSHLLGEPETTIEQASPNKKKWILMKGTLVNEFLRYVCFFVFLPWGFVEG